MIPPTSALAPLNDLDRLAYAFEVISAVQFGTRTLSERCIECDLGEMAHARQDSDCKLTAWLDEVAEILDAAEPIVAGLPASLGQGDNWRGAQVWISDDEADAVEAFAQLAQGVGNP